MRPVGTAEELQHRRLRAVELVDRGESPEELARFFGCGRSSVYTWVKLIHEGVGKLAPKPHHERTPRLGEADRGRLEGLLLEGPRPTAGRPTCGPLPGWPS